MDDTIASERHRLFNNKILKALPDTDLDRIAPLLEKVDLRLGDVLVPAGENVKYIYFPENAIVSVVGYTEDGFAAEVSLIGGEGVSSVAAVFGEASTPYQKIVQLANGGFRMKVTDARTEFARGGAFHDQILKFVSKLLVQISQTALCNRVHSVEKRLSRWLLMTHDRAESDTLLLTQEFLAIMLGVNRSTVTFTAQELQKSGFITYKRGKILILNREGLEAFTCDCYKVITTAYAK